MKFQIQTLQWSKEHKKHQHSYLSNFLYAFQQNRLLAPKYKTVSYNTN